MSLFDIILLAAIVYVAYSYFTKGKESLAERMANVAAKAAKNLIGGAIDAASDALVNNPIANRLAGTDAQSITEGAKKAKKDWQDHIDEQLRKKKERERKVHHRPKPVNPDDHNVPLSWMEQLRKWLEGGKKPEADDSSQSYGGVLD